MLGSLQAQTKKGFDLSGATIPVNEIKDGGPPKDGIPSIDNPKFHSAREAQLADGDRILGVLHDGVAKAYPIAIMNYHEIVNDFFNDDPIVVTYCPLCGSGIAFDATIEGERKTFGVSGLLYNSDVLLYDRQTESLWSQIMNEAVTGPMKGKELEKVITANTTWANWKKDHPESLVLSEDTGFRRDYSRDPYPGYAQSAKLFFQVEEEDDRYHPKETVLGLEVNGNYKAYPFSELSKVEDGILKDSFEGVDLTVEYDAQSQSAQIKDSEGNIIPTITNFWFAWFAFHPDTEVFEHEE